MAGDYMSSMTRSSGSMSIWEYRLLVAFQEGQRDAEQGWPADARRWDYMGPLATQYYRGYLQPRKP
jgi:hypothetical protein